MSRHQCVCHDSQNPDDMNRNRETLWRLVSSCVRHDSPHSCGIHEVRLDLVAHSYHTDINKAFLFLASRQDLLGIAHKILEFFGETEDGAQRKQ